MYCPNCGNEVSNYVRICPNCGELLEPAENAGKPQNMQDSQYTQNVQNNQNTQYTPNTQNTGENSSGYNNYNYYGNQNYGNNINQQYNPAPQIPDYKVQSILLIIFSSVLCCFTCLSIVALPFAIVALVNSNKIHTHIYAGNYDLAMECSKKTKMWCWVSFGILIGAIILGIILYIYVFTSGIYTDFWEQMDFDYRYNY